MKFYIEAMGIAEDENGNPAPGVMVVDMGKPKRGKEIPYGKLIKDKNPGDFIKQFFPGYEEVLTNVRFITPEEYEKNYSEGDAE